MPCVEHGACFTPTLFDRFSYARLWAMHAFLHLVLACHCRFGGLLCSVMNSMRGGEEGCSIDWHDELTKEEFRAVLEKVDSGLRSLPATAQVGLGSCMMSRANWGVMLRPLVLAITVAYSLMMLSSEAGSLCEIMLAALCLPTP